MRGLRELLLNFKNMLNKAYMDFFPGEANIITFSAAPYSLLIRLRCYPTFDATWHVLPKTPRFPPKQLFPFFQEMSCKLFWTPLPHLHYVLASFHEPNGKKFGKFFLKKYIYLQTRLFTDRPDRKVFLGTFSITPTWESNTYVMYRNVSLQGSLDRFFSQYKIQKK